jgi:hypothetical protein
LGWRATKEKLCGGDSGRRRRRGVVGEKELERRKKMSGVVDGDEERRGRPAPTHLTTLLPG